MCDQCGTNGGCGACATAFNLAQQTCQYDQNIVYYNSYFTAPEINSTTINQPMFKLSNQYFT